MAKKNSADLFSDLGELAEAMRDRAIAETRRDVADALQERFLDQAGPSTCGGASPDDCVIEALDSMSDRQLKALRNRFSDEGVSYDFRAGLLFAIRFTADPKWEL